MTIDRKEIEALVRIFDQSDWHELRLETDGLRLVLSKDADTAALQPLGDATPSIAETEPGAQFPSASMPAATGAAANAADDDAPANGLVPITAPNLGTFYRAPKPGTAPYVEVGQSVSETTEVCLIEVMKLFTPVRAGVSLQGCGYGGSGAFGACDTPVGRDRARGTIFVGIHAGRDRRSRQRR